MTHEQGNAEQSNDIEQGWEDVKVYSKDMGGDRYHEVVVSRGGTVRDEFYTELGEHGETREPLHRLRSRKGKRIPADQLVAEFGEGVKTRWNEVTGEIES